MMKIARFTLIAVFMAAPVFADEKNDVARPQVYSELLQCKQLADNAQRLACFDGASTKMEQAANAKDIVILDRAEVKKTKRSLFGFLLPKLPFFDDEEEAEFTNIETVFESVQELGHGKYQFAIPDGGIWQTTEPAKAVLRVGRTLKIKRGAAGGYLMQIGNGGYIRVKRVS